MATLSRSRSVFRRNRVVADPVEQAQSPEDAAWSRKYRQSLADVDLATQFANYMDPEISKCFLDHNREEFDAVLGARPRRRSTIDSTDSPLGSVSEEEPSWQDLNVTRTVSAKPPSSPVKDDELHKSESRESASRSQRMLTRVKSFVSRKPIA